MNRSAYLTTGLAIKALSRLSRARVRIHGADRVPRGALIFAVNHFTRIETLLLPYHIHQIVQKPVWSLASAGLFKGALAAFLDRNGAVSTDHPDRDRLMVKTLLTGEAVWVIFPEGRMVKNKKVMAPEGAAGPYGIAGEDGSRPLHTGAAALALRTEFYRQRLRAMRALRPQEARRLATRYEIDDPAACDGSGTWLVPVNVTYYPLRARENVLNQLARLLFDDLSERLVEEIMTEGTMLLAGVDIDIRFGEPIAVAAYLKSRIVRRDIRSPLPIGFDDAIASRGMLRKTAQRLTQRCMSAIYRLTTLNHDHLFAAMLGLHPRRTLDVDDLRRRVFLATTLDFDRREIHRHRSLAANQVHLITDDRFGKVDNFLRLVEEKGLVRREGENRLVRLKQETGQAPFHRARIDDPVAVMFNEIEPMTDLLDDLEALAAQPALRIRHWVARRLRRQGEWAYQRDRMQFAHIPDATAAGVGAPLLHRAGRSRIGVLLIHGYMAAPREVALLADALAAQGFGVYAPRLPGHGTAPEDLAGRTWADWVAAVDAGYALLANSYRRVVAGGFSTGAGLALDLAARGVPLDGAFAVCPPLSLQDFSSRFVPAVDLWNKLLDRVHWAAGKMEFVVNRPENPEINYKRNPISGVRELSRLMEELETRIEAVQVPTLVIQSLGDPVVDYRGAWRLFKGLGTVDKEFFVFHFDRHGILRGAGAERVHRAIGDFVLRVAATG